MPVFESESRIQPERKSLYSLFRLHVPGTHLDIVFASTSLTTHKEPTIGTEGKSFHSSPRRLHALHELSTGNLPEPDLSRLEVSCCEILTVRAEGKAFIGTIFLRRERLNKLAPRKPPELDALVVQSNSQKGTLGMKGQTGCDVIIAEREGLNKRARLEIPKIDPFLMNWA